MFQVLLPTLGHVKLSKFYGVMFVFGVDHNDFLHAKKSSEVESFLGIKLGQFDPGFSIAGVFLQKRVESFDVVIKTPFSLN